jgi:DeoR/GlpR family transcriptional regulator of sugar metabolism
LLERRYGEVMLLRERQNLILSALRTGGAASVHELAEAMAVSESTIRRDLDILDRNGELTRTYGGAVLSPGRTVDDDDATRIERPFADIDSQDDALKERLADAAAAVVVDGSVIILDIGTTTARIARRLRGRDVTVVTSSLAVLDELRDDDVVRLVMLGGVVRRNYRTLVGSLAELALSQISADMLFLSCTGVRANGHVVDNMAVEAHIKQAMIAASEKIVLLASEKKFPGSGALRLCSVTDVDVLVTTDGAPDDALALCRNAGGQVVVA